MVITLQSGAGARLFRNALLGNHGLTPPSPTVADETVPLLSSFGNLATLLRYFEAFAERYQKEYGKAIEMKMHLGVASVPLGDFEVIQDEETKGYLLHNPNGEDSDPSWIAPRMLDFYGNWKELQTMATMTEEKALSLSSEELKKLGLSPFSSEALTAKRDSARKMQETFLHILRAFAPAQKEMLHPNISLEIWRS